MPAPVFISYARTEASFAIELADLLRAMDFDVWLDEEQLPAGSDFEKRIGRAINVCQTAVFLLSELWLERDWTRYELDRFAALPGKLLIGIRRAPELNIGPRLVGKHQIDWFEEGGTAPREALAWQLRCGILQQAPGARKHWVSRGREVLGGIGGDPTFIEPLVIGAREDAPLSARRNLHLLCGRHKQWAELTSAWEQGQNRLVLLSGQRGEAHEMFLQRAELQVPRSPPRQVLRPDWSNVRTRADYLAALAKTLKTTSEVLEKRLDSQREREHLLVLLPTVSRAFDEAALWQHVSEDLPALVKKPKPFALCAILPVEWRRTNGTIEWMAEFFSWLLPASSPRRDAYLQRRRAESLMRRLGEPRSPAAPRLPPLALEQLRRIDRTDLQSFCGLLNMSDQDTKSYSRQVLFGARSSQEILDSIRTNPPSGAPT